MLTYIFAQMKMNTLGVISLIFLAATTSVKAQNFLIAEEDPLKHFGLFTNWDQDNLGRSIVGEFGVTFRRRWTISAQAGRLDEGVTSFGGNLSYLLVQQGLTTGYSLDINGGLTRIVRDDDSGMFYNFGMNGFRKFRVGNDAFILPSAGVAIIIPRFGSSDNTQVTGVFSIRIGGPHFYFQPVLSVSENATTGTLGAFVYI